MFKIAKKEKERTILVGVGAEYKGDGALFTYDPLEELRLLADTAGALVVGTVTQPRTRIDSTYYIGKGKANELREKVEQLEASSVIFNNDLSPAQVSNLQKLLETKVIDRSGLILDIFAIRARTREAKTQVELAQLKYLLPRLTRQWTHLSRQAGGIGMRGPGETQLEVDRRKIRQRISHLSRNLKKIEKRGHVSRNKRKNRFKAALVGYTNAGKSSLLNMLSGAGVPVENKLFKTLDSVTRVVKFESAPDILLSDTVGFIRNLPHDLIVSFKSTLDEVKDADLLLHVVDITSNEMENNMEVVQNVLTELNAAETETVLVFNKIDVLEEKTRVEALKSLHPSAVFVSAADGTGIDGLRKVLSSSLMNGQLMQTVQFSPSDSKLMSDIYRYGTVFETEVLGEKIKMSFTIPYSIAKKLGIQDNN